jgi:hypothetical protein
MGKTRRRGDISLKQWSSPIVPSLIPLTSSVHSPARGTWRALQNVSKAVLRAWRYGVNAMACEAGRAWRYGVNAMACEAGGSGS